MFSFLKIFFRPNFGLIAVVAMVMFLFSGQLWPKDLTCQNVNCAKASEVLKSDQFWQQNKDKLTNFQKNFQPKGQTSFSLPWVTEAPLDQNTSDSPEKSEQISVDNGQDTENVTEILADKNSYEAQKNDYHSKVLFLLENLNLDKQKKLCQLNFSFVSTSQTEAKIQAICQKVNSQSVQGIQEGGSRPKSDIFVVPEEFLVD